MGRYMHSSFSDMQLKGCTVERLKRFETIAPGSHMCCIEASSQHLNRLSRHSLKTCILGKPVGKRPETDFSGIKISLYSHEAKDLMTLCEPNACGASLGNALHVGSKSCLYEFTELNFSELVC